MAFGNFAALLVYVETGCLDRYLEDMAVSLQFQHHICCCRSFHYFEENLEAQFFMKYAKLPM